MAVLTVSVWEAILRESGYFFFFNKLLNLSMRQVVTQQLEPGGAFSETIRFLCSFLRSEEMFNYY